MTLFQMNIAAKVAGTLLIVAVCTGLIVGWISYTSGKNAMEKLTFQQLTALRTAKESEITSYFEQMQQQARTVSGDSGIAAAMQAFATAYYELSWALDSGRLEHNIDASLADYYQQHFAPLLDDPVLRRQGIESDLPKEAATQYLQHHYISANPNPTATKSQLLRAPADASGWADAHETHHQRFLRYLETFGYYDIFLIEADGGRVVYSVSKELDLATSLLTGPYRDSNLARAFKLAKLTSNEDDVITVDFEPYLPSLGAPAAFIASPIRHEGRTIGVLAFQVPIDRINRIMTGNERWQEHGMGKSGETYLVGQDYTMRSVSRFLVEDRDRYLQLLANLDYPQQKLDRLRRLDTSVLIQDVNTRSVQHALAGDSDTTIVRDYRGVRVLSSYGPIKFGNHDWALISEIDTHEAFAPINELRRATVLFSTLIVFVVAVLAFIVSRSFTRPLESLAAAVKKVGRGDTEIELPVRSNDEIGQLTHEFNSMVANLDQQKLVIAEKIRDNDRLLLNILPEPIADRLKRGETQIADSFSSVSVLFADIVGFTAMSQGVPPVVILSMLDELIGAFDQETQRLGVEKIKTIGDSYMAVCGLPEANPNHANQIATLAINMLERIRQFNYDKGTNLRIRIGAHSGPIVAGVVGSSKFVYDLWGSTVNLASRMESTGIPNQVQVSKDFAQQLTSDVEVSYRGAIDIKGIGLTETFLLADANELY